MGRGRVGQVHTGQGRSSSLQLHSSERLNNFTQQLQTYFKGSDTGLPRRNCAQTCCAEKQEKAYNFRSTLFVLKAFSGMRNTKFSALLVEKCRFGVLFSTPKVVVLLYGDLRIFLTWSAALIFSGYTHRSDGSVHQMRQTTLLLNCSLCPPCEFRYQEEKFGMHRQR